MFDALSQVLLSLATDAEDTPIVQSVIRHTIVDSGILALRQARENLRPGYCNLLVRALVA